MHIAVTNASGLYTFTDSTGQTGSLSGTAVQVAAANSRHDLRTVLRAAPDDGVAAINSLGGVTQYTQSALAINPAATATFVDASNLAGGSLVVSGGQDRRYAWHQQRGGHYDRGAIVSYNGTPIGTCTGGAGVSAADNHFQHRRGGQRCHPPRQCRRWSNRSPFPSTTASVAGSRPLSFQVTENSGATNTGRDTKR